ncbi:hypothetical protein [Pontibacter populi]|uniref:DUF4468 domain-containing protein n=1 Tax=Pontibacter populi TaxID=890055 RepID=A0ABV1RYK4_9BACT
MPASISVEKPAVIKANAKFMGRAAVKAAVKMPLLDKNGYHTLVAETGSAQPELLKPILKSTNLMSVKSGSLQSASVSVTLKRSNASGTMRVLYQNFKIELLSESEGNEQSLGKKIISKAANKLAIKSDNPEDGEKPRTGKIYVTRKKIHSFFTYWKDCLASVFLSSIGLKALSEK